MSHDHALANDTRVPSSVANLWHGAQVSHREIVSADRLLEAIRMGGGSGSDRASLSLAIQESGPAEMVDLMIDKVISGKGLHTLLTSLRADGSIHRDDLVQWSGMFA